MINQEDNHKKSKFLVPNQNANSTSHVFLESAMSPMIRDNASHPRRDVGPPVSCARVTTELGVSVASAVHSAAATSVKRAESLHRKGECINGAVPAGNGVQNGSGTSNSVKSTRDGYREKALEEIRNSLKPYATSDPHEGIYEFSSASSSASESSGASQATNNWSSMFPNSNGFQNLNVQQAFHHLIAMGHSEVSDIILLDILIVMHHMIWNVKVSELYLYKFHSD